MIGGGPSLCSSTMVNSNIYLLILIPPFQCLAWLGGYSFHYRTNGEPFRSYTIAWVPLGSGIIVWDPHEFSSGKIVNIQLHLFLLSLKRKYSFQPTSNIKIHPKATLYNGLISSRIGTMVCPAIRATINKSKYLLSIMKIL